MTRKKILVLGAAGNVGEPLVQELAKRGADVRAAVRRVTGRARDFKNVEFVDFDYMDPSTYGKVFAHVERVYLLTPVLENPLDVVEDLLQAAKDAGVKYVVRQSAYGADLAAGQKVRLLSVHRDAERMIEEAGIPYAFLRPMGFFQNYSNFMAHEILERNAFSLPMADARVCYIDARDVALVAANVLLEDGHEGEMYTLSGSEPLSNQDIANIFTRVVGRTIRYEPISELHALENLRAVGMPEWLCQGMVELQRFWREGHAQLISPLVQKLTEKLPIRFERFARDYAEAFVMPTSRVG